MKIINFKPSHIMLAICAALSLTACSTPLTGNNYNATEARVIQDVAYGTIVSMRTVSIDGSNSGQGSGTGALAGAVIGSNYGSGTNNVLNIIGGGLLGTVAGQGLEEVITRKNAVELIVSLESGRRIAIVQEKTEPAFVVGQKVRVMSIGSVGRVVPADEI